VERWPPGLDFTGILLLLFFLFLLFVVIFLTLWHRGPSLHGRSRLRCATCLLGVTRSVVAHSGSLRASGTEGSGRGCRIALIFTILARIRLCLDRNGVLRASYPLGIQSFDITLLTLLLLSACLIAFLNCAIVRLIRSILQNGTSVWGHVLGFAGLLCFLLRLGGLRWADRFGYCGDRHSI